MPHSVKYPTTRFWLPVPGAGTGFGATSSLLIVPVADAVAIAAPVAAEMVTVNVSSGSTTVSAITGTDTVAVVAPAAMVIVLADKAW